MKISMQWLQEWVAVREPAKVLAERLTLAGLEVGAVTDVATALEGVVVGEITATAPHPQADSLRVCTVNVGQKQPLTIVCGAANAATGLKVPAALEGAVLAGGKKIGRATVRGVESAGMLCSATELGLEEGAQGLLVLDATAKPGTAIAKHLLLHDQQLEVELTPNRGDCLSIQGLAREIAALTGWRHTPAAIRMVPAKSRSRLPVTLTASKACPRYAGRMIEAINPQARTPDWMRERLRRGGVRCIHPVVDITNYVMLELGQPMHAFNADKLNKQISVRYAKKSEKIALLDGKDLSLDPTDLVIADAKGAVALAGIMGGQLSAVSEATTNIFLESAWFHPDVIGLRARHYGLHSESSHRFERGVDPELQRLALERATALVLQICSGRAGPVTEAKQTKNLPRRAAIPLREARMLRVLGMSLAATQVEGILKRLGLKVQRAGTKAGVRQWKATPPSWRFDLTREVDLIEELARVNGYDKVPVHRPNSNLTMKPLPEARVTASRLRAVMVDRDYHEAVTYSFVDPTKQALLTPHLVALNVANPIAADLAQMRTSLWPGLLQAVLHNQNRQQPRVRLFEIGRKYLVTAPDRTDEVPVIAGVATGTVMAEQWGSKARSVDFYDVKGDVEALLAQTGTTDFVFRAAKHPALHPGQSAEILTAGSNKPCGYVGALNPDIQAKFGLDSSAIVFEIALATLQVAKLPKFTEISKFPSIRRDLALEFDVKLAARDVLATAKKHAGPLLINLELFDEYRGEGIDSGRKSLALGLTFQDTSRTLNDRDVETAVGQVVQALTQAFGGKLRQ
jgi:phenylalanyl-tRNA synthetase beta chain